MYANAIVDADGNTKKARTEYTTIYYMLLTTNIHAMHSGHTGCVL